MASWSLPHTEFVRIFGDGTPEYVLLRAPHVILISSQVIPHPKQVLTLAPRTGLNSPHGALDPVL